jgi:hypothetical protein
MIKKNGSPFLVTVIFLIDIHVYIYDVRKSSGSVLINGLKYN